MNEKTERILAISILIAGVLVLAIRRYYLPHNYPDSLKYAQYVDIFLGRNTAAEPIPAPFIYRPLVPLIASLPSLFVDSITGLIITSMIFATIWVVILYYICLEIVPSNLTAFIVSGAALLNPAMWLYAGSPLVDVPTMCFVGAIVLLAMRRESPYAITLLVIFGSLAKELVLFAGVFYLLYRRDLKSILPLFSGVCVTLLYRFFMTGSVSQPLAFHEIQPWFLLHTFQTLGVLSILALFGLLALKNLDIQKRSSVIQLFIIGFTAFMPYLLLGVFFVFYGPRFAWPVQLSLIPLACVGVKYILDLIFERQHMKKRENNESSPIEKSVDSTEVSNNEPRLDLRKL